MEDREIGQADLPRLALQHRPTLVPRAIFQGKGALRRNLRLLSNHLKAHKFGLIDWISVVVMKIEEAEPLTLSAAQRSTRPLLKMELTPAIQSLSA